MVDLSQPDCRGIEWSPEKLADCTDASRNFSQSQGCEDPRPSGQDCFYGNADFTPASSPCVLTNTVLTRCAGAAGQRTRWEKPSRFPNFCIKFKSGNKDADGLIVPFFSTETWITVLPNTMTFEVERCAPENTCPIGEFHGIWKTRTFYQDGGGWGFQCTEILKNPTFPAGSIDQHTEDDLPLVLKLNGGLNYVDIAVTDKPGCFLLADQFCYTSYCNGNNPGKLVSCIGDSIPQRARVLDSLDCTIVPELGDSLAVPPREKHLLNAAWNKIQDLVDKLDAPGHSPLQHYTSSSIALWKHSVAFGIQRMIEVNVSGIIGTQTFEITMNALIVASYTAVGDDTVRDVVTGLVDAWNASPDKGLVVASNQETFLRLNHQTAGEVFSITLNVPGGGVVFTKSEITDGVPDPVVQGNGVWYPFYEGVDIPISLQGSVSGSVYATDAKLTLQKVVILCELNSESSAREPNFTTRLARVTGAIRMTLWMRVKRTVGTSPGKFVWLNESNAFDLRVEDPAIPGVVHPRETLIALGPEREKVWRQSDDDPTEGAQKVFELLKTTQRLSRGPNVFSGVGGTQPCCDILSVINGVVLQGKTDDNRGLDDLWWKVTTITVLSVPAGHQFFVDLDGVNIVDYTDSTEIIEDVVDNMISQWNGSANSLASKITATKIGTTQVLLTADEPLSETNGLAGKFASTREDPNADVEQGRFTELPQFYNGSASFAVDLAGTSC